MDILSSLDVTRGEIGRIFSLADAGRAGRMGQLAGRAVALFFEEPSTRTRTSFEVAASRLGAHAVYIDARTAQFSRGEEISDTAKMLSTYCDFIVARVNDHAQLITMAESSSVPVINALTHLEHPTQALADCYTIIQKKGAIRGLKIAFIGDIAQNTANSLMVTAARLGADISLVGPKACRPNQKYVSAARKDGNVTITDSIKDGLAKADIVYTDTFVSMGDEAEAKRRMRLYSPYRLDAAALSFAKKDALVMHPLPAHRGAEITADVIDGKKSIVWEQARSKLTIADALLRYLSR